MRLLWQERNLLQHSQNASCAGEASLLMLFKRGNSLALGEVTLAFLRLHVNTFPLAVRTCLLWSRHS